uniref:Uncharacterized protein n=1 Tax=Tetraselmis sp. GSL018 TaxID=582737 RepID=A0A061QM10_9CHLO
MLCFRRRRSPLLLSFPRLPNVTPLPEHLEALVKCVSLPPTLLPLQLELGLEPLPLDRHPTVLAEQRHAAAEGPPAPSRLRAEADGPLEIGSLC